MDDLTSYPFDQGLMDRFVERNIPYVVKLMLASGDPFTAKLAELFEVSPEHQKTKLLSVFGSFFRAHGLTVLKQENHAKSYLTH